MRLLECYIENFGKLHDFSIGFEKGLTVINEKNGWGKSTLAAFIKVMFYGFANEKKRGDALERERVRFKPWQGGAYGGELVFEADGKRYLLNRTFGAKESDDTFALYDAATNLATDDFSRNIGEELFEIDQESFLRTIYIAQNDCATGATDSINAKMGNLAGHLDDINQYEKVQQVLKDMRNSLTPGRKTGELRKLRDEIDGLKNEVRKSGQVEQAVLELEKKIEASGRERETALREQEALQEELLALGGQKEIAARREQYEKILRQCGERQTAMKECEAFFGGAVPGSAQLRQMAEKRKELIQQESDRQANMLTPDEETDLADYKKRFLADMPGEETLDRGRALAERLDDLQKEAASRGFSAEERREAEELGRSLGGGHFTEEDIDYYLQQWDLYNGIKIGLGAKRAALDSLKAAGEGDGSRSGGAKGKAALWSLLAPLCLALAGIALCWVEPMAGGILIAAGGLMLIICLILQMRMRKKYQKRDSAEAERGVTALEREIAQDEERMAALRDETLHFLDGFAVDGAWEGRSVQDMLYGLKGGLQRLGRLQARQMDYRAMRYEERIAEGKDELQTLLLPYYSPQEIRERGARELLADLDSSRQAFLRLAAKQERYRRADEARAALRAELEEFLRVYGQEGADMDAALGQMSQRLAGYEADVAELEKCQNERAAFEQEYDVRMFQADAPGAARGTEEVKALLESVAERLERIRGNQNAYLAQLDERQQEAEQLELAAERLEELEGQYERKYLYYCNLERTSEYLAKAKERFSARYMDPILRAFRQNYERMSRISGEDFRMDANIRLTRREAGEQRDIRAFSAGSQDLMGICLRMALIEAMYRKERPFLIFDDSFMNLDGERLEYAKDFLRDVAERYQTVYFTCHESRA